MAALLLANPDMELDVDYSGYYSTELREVCVPYEEDGKLIIAKVVTEE
jgi:hypothetical protein